MPPNLGFREQVAVAENAIHNRSAAMPRAATIKRVGFDAIPAVLAAGWRDFRAAPQYGLAVGGGSAVFGWALVALLFQADLPYLVYPLAIGFAFLAPFIVTVLYAVSRMQERGERLTWSAVATAVRHTGRRDLGWMALVTGFALFIWVDAAAMLFFTFHGMRLPTLEDLFLFVFTTETGLWFFLVGNAVGTVLATVVFSISVTSFPMLYDREIDFVTAMVTSVKVVLANPLTMLAWGMCIGVLTVLSLATALAGFIVTLPLLGHASWHMYRRALEIGPDP